MNNILSEISTRNKTLLGLICIFGEGRAKLANLSCSTDLGARVAAAQGTCSRWLGHDRWARLVRVGLGREVKDGLIKGEGGIGITGHLGTTIMANLRSQLFALFIT